MNAVKIPKAAPSNKSTADACPKRTVIHSVRRSFSAQRGFTLVEVAVSGSLLAITFLGIFGGLFYAYNTAAEVRYRDSARFIIKSFGDQFLVMPALTLTGAPKPFWTTTTSPTGVGLSWRDFNGVTTTDVDGTPAGLVVHLGGSTGTPINAVITRDVRYLNANGQIVSNIAESSAGYLLRGDFTITYTLNGKPQSQTLSLVRARP